ncbi:MAG: hypothetical protein P8177_08075 [Gemmatimonadota bacterium]|jgi:hypothetical protein
MTPVGPLSPRRLPEQVRRRIDVAAATAWEALVEVHAGHALRFIALLAERMDFDEAVDRYVGELDVREPMASAVRSRVLVALEHAVEPSETRPSLPRPGSETDAEEEDASGLARFRPDRLVEEITRKVRESEELVEWIALAVARAEESVIRAHVDNAVVFAALLREHRSMSDAVEDYLEELRVSGGRAQSVHQRTMARLADAHLPGGEPESDGEGTG